VHVTLVGGTDCYRLLVKTEGQCLASSFVSFEAI
jgi:hypothetical protein